MRNPFKSNERGQPSGKSEFSSGAVYSGLDGVQDIYVHNGEANKQVFVDAGLERLTPMERPATYHRTVVPEITTAAVGSTLTHGKYEVEILDAPGKMLQEKVDSKAKPMIEIAGPTFTGFDAMADLRFPKKVYSSNIYPGLPFNDVEGQTGLVGKVDFQADSARLPVQNESVSVVLASCVQEGNAPQGTGLRADSIREAMRVLEPGGLLFWQGARFNDVMTAEQVGFRPIRSVYSYNETMEPRVFHDPYTSRDIQIQGQLSFVFEKLPS